MKVAEIYKILDQIAPFEAGESWDNSGLLVGSMSDEFDKIYASLDIDSNLVNNLEPNSLLITHHPLIFSGLKKLDFSRYPANLIKVLIKKDIKLISMHTNFDKFVLNKFVMSEILGLESFKSVDFLEYAKFDGKFSDFCDFLKDKLCLDSLKVVKAKDEISTFSLCTGSGMSMVDMVEADAFITGDIKYHDALTAKENGLNLVDITHFESEKYFSKALVKNLQKFSISAIITNSTNPFSKI
ncbi:Nif3-like dinuclear metal center hexameric protein [Campylobacter corcagiensis]|uniref:GTP cyclohydrolase 1 type 2 homolog n=1 Tax=Campylobacter corcagiensis TaxID=1448857 RepID=A0A7M1LH96_9BACT|nr:Nif3-like dinuclear metal center hexameric protein [Campylobacter corcagiensis]QKF64400.1 Nif3-like dinuclear metal center protein, putative GTP cyclohydrolase [Campylobacter corcagiensis]QOQ87414.1 Nif3-like dinuclear metal center hexameric protein [Campylobacter corcagiensis]